MKATLHREDGKEEKVKILDIFVDKDGAPKMLFIGEDNQIDTAPIGRFTDMEDEGLRTDGYR
ncbi:MAG: hypothetical protein U9Q31_01440 [Chloroflexota bacterium]|nr:hypothetical protein [Chloroflexota bacterium]